MNFSRLASLVALYLIANTCTLTAQENQQPITRPRPYFFSGMELDGNGSKVVNYVVGAGVQQETSRLMLDSYALYTNTRKTNDNTIDNLSGRTRMLYAAPRYRLRNGWFFGAGGRWNQLSTTNYVKQAWRAFGGGGKDWPAARITVDYLRTVSEHVNAQGCPVPNGQCTNGVQGLDFLLFVPSPRSRSHFLFRMDLTSFWFHTTVTTTDPVLTKRQLGEVSVGSTLSYTMLVRY